MTTTCTRSWTSLNQATRSLRVAGLDFANTAVFLLLYTLEYSHFKQFVPGKKQEKKILVKTKNAWI